MDKNMISIDDLLKQRLSNGEEKEREGAWSNMSSLLDKEMPVRTPVAVFNWRRVITVVTGAALLAAVSVGGYEMVTSFRANNAAEIIAANNTGNIPGNNNTSTSNSKSTSTITSSNASDNLNNNGNDGTDANIAATANEDKSSSTTNEKATDNKKVINKSVTADTKIATGSKNNSKDLAATDTKLGSKSIMPSSGSVKTKIPTSKSGNGLNINDKESITAPAASGNNANATANNSQSKPVNDKPAPAANTAGVNTKQAGTGNDDLTNNNNKGGVKPPAKPADKNNGLANTSEPTNDLNPDAKREKQFKDSINMIATKEKYSVKEGWKLDTIEKGKMARFDVVPVNPSDAKLINDIIPGASIAGENIKMEPLEKNKISAKKTGNNYGNGASRFEEMVKATKFNMSKITFHSGVMGGINSSIAKSNSTAGFQLGLFGVANISEHVSIFSEIKYAQRWGGSNVVSDNYNSNKQEIPTSAGYILHTWDSVEHSFKYPSLNSIHLPVAVRYAVKRISLFCGADFGYNFSVNAEEIEQSNGIKVSQVTPLSAEGLRYDYTKTGPSITYKDFSSRIDLGGMVGVSYSLTPSTMIDLRVVQSMWNNAKTSGEITVYEELYNNPSVQFNISYRFRNNKFRAYHR
jgi:hypothetical protein